MRRGGGEEEDGKRGGRRLEGVEKAKEVGGRRGRG